jgi:hypothetical protein
MENKWIKVDITDENHEEIDISDYEMPMVKSNVNQQYDVNIFVMCLIANHIYLNFEQFMGTNDGKVGETFNEECNMVKILKDQYPHFDNKVLKSMALGMTLYLCIMVANTNQSQEYINNLIIDSFGTAIDNIDNMDVESVD